MALWTMADATSDLWLDGSDASTITLDSGVALWQDKSGNAHHASSSPGNRPSILSAELNGLDVVSWTFGNIMSGTMARTRSAMAVFQVVRFASGSGQYARAFTQDAGANDWDYSGAYLGCRWNNPTGQWLAQIQSGSLLAPQSLSLDTTNILGSVHDGAIISNRTNGGAESTAAHVLNTSVTNYRLGRDLYDSGTYGRLVGYIAEVIVLGYTPSTDLRQKIEGYLAHKWGLTASLPIAHPYKDAAPTLFTELLAVCNQPYSLLGNFFDVVSEQPYSITNSVETSLLQLYSSLLEIWSAQLYGDVPLKEKSLIQPYRDASIMQKELLQNWGTALEMEVGLIQPWQMPESLEAVSDQRYGIAAAVLQATSEQLYHIHANSELFSGLVQPYAMAAEAAAIYIFDTQIFVDGERIPFITCDWQATKSEYAWHVDFSVKSLAIATRCAEGAEIVIVSAGDSYRFKCYDGWRLDKRYLETSYRIEAWSPTRDLDLTAPMTGDLSGMASVIAADLATPYGITVDWQLADGYIADGKLTANNETPLAVIRKLVEDGNRGRMQTAADGVTLLCVCGTETPIPDWPAVTPAQVIDARIERRSTTWQNDIQPGHNSFIVSDQLAAGQTEQLIDNLIDSRTADVRLYVTPLADSPGYTLEHSGGASVSIEPMDIVSEVVVDELVSVEGGIGKTRLPIYEVVARAWREQRLGDIRTSEDGIIQADIAGYSLLRLSYTTRFYQWFARDSKIEEVQFIARRAD